VARESGLEARGCRALLALGFETVKCGKNGLPDRLVITGPCRHIWHEWKQPGGALTPAQKRRIPKMRLRGEIVYIVDTLEAATLSAITHRSPPR
jgi:hypothetical protein